MWRWIALLALILVEVLILTVRFDSGSIAGDPVWAGVLSQTPILGQFAIALAAALLVFSGDRFHLALMRIAAQATHVRFPWFTLAVHLVAFTALFQLTAIVFEGRITSSRLPWVGAWLLTLFGWIALWLAAALPMSIWRSLLVRAPRILSVSIAATVAAMLAGYAVEALWRPLAASTFWFVERVLGLFYLDVVSRSHDLVIGTSKFSVEIAPTCSGLEGIGLILVFLGVFFWCFRHEFRFPHAFLLLPAAVATIWVVNALRIAALVAVGSSVSRETAVGGFHSQAGWIAFNAVALAFVAVAWRIAWFRNQPDRSESATLLVTNPTAPYLIPLLSLIATAMITGVFSSGFDRFYAVRVFVAGAAICVFAQRYRQDEVLNWKWSATPIAIGAIVFGLWMAAEPFLARTPPRIPPWLKVWLACPRRRHIRGLSFGRLVPFSSFRLRKNWRFEVISHDDW